MTDFIFNRRQRIDLSEEAYDIIKNDRFTFAQEKAISYSDIICRVFLSFVEYSAARNKNVQKINEYLSKKRLSTHPKIPSMQNDVLEYLSQSSIIKLVNEKEYGGSPGKFIKAVIEEYAEKTFVERERIFYRDIIEKITSNMNKQIRVTSGNSNLIVIPYEILPDRQSTYNYLVGLVDSETNPNKFEIASLRISRLRQIHPIADSISKLEDFNIEKIKTAISQKGVQFLRGELCRVVVELTDVGKALFNSMLFQRPVPICIKGDIYEFWCTEAQAEFYFFKFGATVEIIEPQILRRKFSERYSRAAEIYNASDSK